MKKRKPATTKKELVRSVYYSQEKTKRQGKLPVFVLEDVLDCLLDNIADAIVRGEYVYLRGFGTFRSIKAATVFTDTTSTKIAMGPGRHRRVYNTKLFKCSPELYEKINTGEKHVFSTYFGDSTNFE